MTTTNDDSLPERPRRTTRPKQNNSRDYAYAAALVAYNTYREVTIGKQGRMRELRHEQNSMQHLWDDRLPPGESAIWSRVVAAAEEANAPVDLYVRRIATVTILEKTPLPSELIGRSAVQKFRDYTGDTSTALDSWLRSFVDQVRKPLDPWCDKDYAEKPHEVRWMWAFQDVSMMHTSFLVFRHCFALLFNLDKQVGDKQVLAKYAEETELEALVAYFMWRDLFAGRPSPIAWGDVPILPPGFGKKAMESYAQWRAIPLDTLLAGLSDAGTGINRL